MFLLLSRDWSIYHGLAAMGNYFSVCVVSTGIWGLRNFLCQCFPITIWWMQICFINLLSISTIWESTNVGSVAGLSIVCSLTSWNWPIRHRLAASWNWLSVWVISTSIWGLRNFLRQSSYASLSWLIAAWGWGGWTWTCIASWWGWSVEWAQSILSWVWFLVEGSCCFWCNHAAWCSCSWARLSSTSLTFNRCLDWWWSICDLKRWILDVIILCQWFSTFHTCLSWYKTASSWSGTVFNILTTWWWSTS